MFLDEARLSLHLQHANIVQVFDIGHADETYFIVMEFVDGIDLKRLLEWRRRIGRPLTIGQTVYIIMEVGQGAGLRARGGPSRDRAPAGHRPPRRLAAQRAAQPQRRGQADRLRPGQGGGAGRDHRPGRGEGEDELPVARGGAGRRGGSPGGHLRRRHPAVRDADREAPVLRRDRLPDGGAGAGGEDPAHRPAEPRGGAGAGGDRPQGAGPPARRPLPERHRSAGRAGALPVLARAEDDPAGHRRSGAQLHRGHDDASGAARKPKANIIDTLLQDEIQSFTSVEFGGEKFDEAGSTIATNSPLAVPGMPSGDYIDPRGWADDTDQHRRRLLQQATSRKPTGDVRVKQPSGEGQRVPAPPTGAPPLPPATAGPPRPPAVPARQPSRPNAAVASQPTKVGYQQVNEPRFHPTPPPDQLAQVLEPGGQLIRRMPKGVDHRRAGGRPGDRRGLRRLAGPRVSVTGRRAAPVGSTAFQSGMRSQGLRLSGQLPVASRLSWCCL